MVGTGLASYAGFEKLETYFSIGLLQLSDETS